MSRNYNTETLEKIGKACGNLSEKIDILYTLESVIQNMDWLYHTDTVYDEEGNCLKDENDNYVYQKSDDNFNKILDDMIQYAVKKYS